MLATLIVLGVTLGWGLPRKQLQVAEVVAGQAAATAGMEPGDIFVSVGARPLRDVGQVSTAISRSEGEPVSFVMRRGEENVSIAVQPRLVAGTKETYRIGIRFGQAIGFESTDTVKAIQTALLFPFRESAKILGSLKKIVTARVSTKQIGGPVEIVYQLRSSFRAGLGTALIFLAMLSVYLGLFNLLPIPALDGGRIVFILVETITRRPINQRVENAIHTAGFVILMGLIVLVTIGDLSKRF